MYQETASETISAHPSCEVPSSSTNTENTTKSIFEITRKKLVQLLLNLQNNDDKIPNLSDYMLRDIGLEDRNLQGDNYTNQPHIRQSRWYY